MAKLRLAKDIPATARLLLLYFRMQRSPSSIDRNVNRYLQDAAGPAVHAKAGPFASGVDVDMSKAHGLVNHSLTIGWAAG
jgi:hypothetical protein